MQHSAVFCKRLWPLFRKRTSAPGKGHPACYSHNFNIAVFTIFCQKTGEAVELQSFCTYILSKHLYGVGSIFGVCSLRALSSTEAWLRGRNHRVRSAPLD